MPKLSVWFVRAALIYLAIGLSFGGLALVAKDAPNFVWAWRFLPFHTELMIFGWMIPFVIGIAYWILPRFSTRPDPYGKTWLGWCSFVLLNSGLLLRLVGAWQTSIELSALAYLALLGAVICFAVLIYPRIKPLATFPTNQS